MGMAIAQQMVGSMNNAFQNINTPGVDTMHQGKTHTQDQFFYAMIKDKQVGPLSLKDLCDLINKKEIVSETYLWNPGLIGWKANPGGGTTDYAVNIFHEALKHNKYTCFLSEKTTLPMMYMADAIKATIQIMQTDSKNIKVRSSYNIAGCSFNPLEIATLIKSEIPNFTIDYNTDFRQEIADSWPQSIDDSSAKLDWKWEKEYDLNKMTTDMMRNLKKKYNLS